MARSKQNHPEDTQLDPAGAAAADAQTQQQQQLQPTQEQQEHHGQGGTDEAAREHRIREAAYAAAERRGFAPGYEVEDWLEAERSLGAAPTPQAHS